MNKICVIGCGFVGAALSVAIFKENNSNFVYVLDQNSEEGKRRLNALSKGIFPFEITDEKLKKASALIPLSNRFFSSFNPESISNAEIILITINIDIESSFDGIKKVSKKGFSILIENLKKFAKPKSLIILMSTVPPGTTRYLEKFINKDRSIHEKVYIAHSYERIMPGKNYYESIISQPRVLSSISEEGKTIAKTFLSTFSSSEINFLSKPEESETAKLLENTYRAINIALIDEWTKFCSLNNIDLNAILTLIRKRPTHQNIMSPGIGVGGYCLTKDLHFPEAAEEFINDKSIIKSSDFPIAKLASEINSNMPKHCLNFFTKRIPNESNLFFMGLAYRQDVGDIRFSPSLTLLKLLLRNNFNNIKVFDPFVMEEINIPGFEGIKIINDLGKINLGGRKNILIFSVNHSYFSSKIFMNFIESNNSSISKIIDLCNLSKYSFLKTKFKSQQLGTDF